MRYLLGQGFQLLKPPLLWYLDSHHQTLVGFATHPCTPCLRSPPQPTWLPFLSIRRNLFKRSRRSKVMLRRSTSKHSRSSRNSRRALYTYSVYAYFYTFTCLFIYFPRCSLRFTFTSLGPGGSFELVLFAAVHQFSIGLFSMKKVSKSLGGRGRCCGCLVWENIVRRCSSCRCKTSSRCTLYSFSNVNSSNSTRKPFKSLHWGYRRSDWRSQKFVNADPV